jgi:hypothetical protein
MQFRTRFEQGTGECSLARTNFNQEVRLARCDTGYDPVDDLLVVQKILAKPFPRRMSHRHMP